MIVLWFLQQKNSGALCYKGHRYYSLYLSLRRV